MKKIFMATLLAIALAFGNQAVAAANALTFEGRYDFNEMVVGYDAEGIVDPDVDFLALRTGPSTDYPMITRIPPGARVQVHGHERDPWPTGAYWGRYFVSVTYRGMNGYAHSKYITIIPNSIRGY